jgi:type II secretory pathway component GspD/PulD (secretin)
MPLSPIQPAPPSLSAFLKERRPDARFTASLTRRFALASLVPATLWLGSQAAASPPPNRIDVRCSSYSDRLEIRMQGDAPMKPALRRIRPDTGAPYGIVAEVQGRFSSTGQSPRVGNGVAGARWLNVDASDLARIVVSSQEELPYRLISSNGGKTQTLKVSKPLGGGKKASAAHPESSPRPGGSSFALPVARAPLPSFNAAPKKEPERKLAMLRPLVLDMSSSDAKIVEFDSGDHSESPPVSNPSDVVRSSLPPAAETRAEPATISLSPENRVLDLPAALRLPSPPKETPIGFRAAAPTLDRRPAPARRASPSVRIVEKTAVREKKPALKPPTPSRTETKERDGLRIASRRLPSVAEPVAPAPGESPDATPPAIPPVSIKASASAAKASPAAHSSSPPASSRRAGAGSADPSRRTERSVPLPIPIRVTPSGKSAVAPAKASERNGSVPAPKEAKSLSKTTPSGSARPPKAAPLASARPPKAAPPRAGITPVGKAAPEPKTVFSAAQYKILTEDAPEEPAEPKKVRLDFVGADVQEVFRALAAQSQSNIIVSPSVKGEITTSLRDMTVEEALDALSRMAGAAYKKTDNTYYIGTREELDKMFAPPPVTRTYSLHSEGAIDLATTVKTAVPELADAVAIGKSLIVLKGPETAVETATALLPILDANIQAATPQASPPIVRIREIHYLDPASTVTKLTEVFGSTLKVSQAPDILVPVVSATGGGAESGGGAGGGGGSQNPATSSTLVLIGPKDVVDKAEEMLQQLDVAPRQIEIEAQVLDVNVDRQSQRGIRWTWTTSVDFSEGSGATTGTTGATGTTGTTDNAFSRAGSSALRIGQIARTTPFSLSAQIANAIQIGDAKVLAQPSIRVIEGRTARIFIGDTLRIVIGRDVTPTGTTIQTAEFNPGITLLVSGHSSPDGYVTLDLRPTVSSLTTLEAAGTDIPLPQIRERSVQTVIRVKDGDTMVIGGLLQDSDIQNVSKVPGLGDLPFFGNLFRWRTLHKTHSEVVIFLTTRILKS